MHLDIFPFVSYILKSIAAVIWPITLVTCMSLFSSGKLKLNPTRAQHNGRDHSLSVDICLSSLTWLQNNTTCWRNHLTMKTEPSDLILEHTFATLHSGELLPSPWGPVVLLKVQCSSLIKWPLSTMSWRVFAFSRPTLMVDERQQIQTHVSKSNLTSRKWKRTWWCHLWCNITDTPTSVGPRSGSPNVGS